MKNYTVTAHPDVLNQLAALWVKHRGAGVGDAIARSSDLIDELLATHPETAGSVVSANVRLLTIRPLSVLFAVFEEDRVVMLLEYRWTPESPLHL